MKTAVLILAMVFYSLPAFAHKISAFVDVEGDTVSVFSYFSDGTPAKHAKVDVYDEKTGKLILSGKTDKKGEFHFTVKKPSNYKIVVEAELGHRAVAEVKEGEFGGGPESTGEIEKTETVQPGKEHKQEAISNITEEELRKIIRKEVEAQLKPIHQELLNLKIALSKITFKDIFSGLGWILGIFGAAALVYARKEKGKQDGFTKK